MTTFVCAPLEAHPPSSFVDPEGAVETEENFQGIDIGYAVKGVSFLIQQRRDEIDV